MSNEMIKELSKEFSIPQSDEPVWAKRIDPIVVLGRGIPAWSRTLGRMAYCVAGIEREGEWCRLYPVPLENGKRLLNAFDIIKPFIIKRHENGRPESCRVNSWLIWKGGTIPTFERQKILHRTLESGAFLHDDSWRNKTLGLIKPAFWEFHIGKKATLRYFCDFPECEGHIATFFDVLEVTAKQRKLIKPANELLDLLSQLENEKIWFVVGTIRQHPQRWIVVESIVELDKTVIPLQSWLTSNMQ